MRIELAKMILVCTRITYQATGDAGCCTNNTSKRGGIIRTAYACGTYVQQYACCHVSDFREIWFNARMRNTGSSILPKPRVLKLGRSEQLYGTYVRRAAASSPELAAAMVLAVGFILAEHSGNISKAKPVLSVWCPVQMLYLEQNGVMVMTSFRGYEHVYEYDLSLRQSGLSAVCPDATATCAYMSRKQGHRTRCLQLLIHYY